MILTLFFHCKIYLWLMKTAWNCACRRFCKNDMFIYKTCIWQENLPYWENFHFSNLLAASEIWRLISRHCQPPRPRKPPNLISLCPNGWLKPVLVTLLCHRFRLIFFLLPIEKNLVVAQIVGILFSFADTQKSGQNFNPSILPNKFGLIFMGMKQKKFFFFRKKNSKWPFFYGNKIASKLQSFLYIIFSKKNVLKGHTLSVLTQIGNCGADAEQFRWSEAWP